MRKVLYMLIGIPLLGFSMGGQPDITASVKALLIDKAGKKHKVDALICDEKTFFEVQDGDVILKIPFDKIQKVEILPSKEPDKVLAVIKFKNGQERKFLLPKDVLCVGLTPVGTLEAYIDHLKEIDFLSN
ncbi:MAG: hypothetical protein ABGX24_02425 [Aquificota bacterium]|jgi:hypothetical protein